MFCSPLEICLCHKVAPSRSMRTCPEMSAKPAPTTSSGAQAGAAEFGSGEVEVVALLLKLVIRKLIPVCDADAKGASVVGNNVNAGKFSFFAPILGVRRNNKRLKMSSKGEAVALVEPLRGDANRPFSRTSLFDTPLEHAHAVSECLFLFRFVLLSRKMHRLALPRAPEMSEAGASDEEAGRFARNIHGWEQMPGELPLYTSSYDNASPVARARACSDMDCDCSRHLRASS